MQPTTLIDVFRSDCDEPVLSVAEVRTEFHYQVCELVEIRTRSEVLNCFVFEHADFLWRETVHFDDFQCLSIKFEWERKLLKLAEPFVQSNQSLHVSAALVALFLAQNFSVCVQLINIHVAIGAA